MIQHLWQGITWMLHGGHPAAVGFGVAMPPLHWDTVGAIQVHEDMAARVRNIDLIRPAQVFTGGLPLDLMMTRMPAHADMDTGVLAASAESIAQLAEARKLYEVAEFHARVGQVLAAYHYYQEAHLLSPISRVGQVALDKLTQIEAQVLAARDGRPLGVSNAVPVSDDFEASSTPVPPTQRLLTEDEQYLQRLGRAQEMYHVGESCRARGDLDKAFACYHEVRRLCPDSDYANMAARRMRRIETLRQLRNVQDEQTTEEAADMSLWLTEALRLLGGSTQVEFDVDFSRGDDNRRIRGSLFIGPIGCQVIAEGDNVRFVWPGGRDR
jgi:hypothetical protein